jgi:hypothetical protein
MAKCLAAQQWAIQNNGTFTVITEKDLKVHMDMLLSSDLTDDIKRKLRSIK